MPIVKMPDGTQVRFPDDMPREQIRGMIASKFPDAAKSTAPSPSDLARGNTPMDTLTTGGRAPIGLQQPGNLDLNRRQVFNGPEGDYRTENSMSIGTDNGEVLLPTIVGGQQFSDQDAIDHYFNTGENLGTFKTPEAADQYAQTLHLRQEQQYAPKQPVQQQPDQSYFADLPVPNYPAPNQQQPPPTSAGQEVPSVAQIVPQGLSGLNEGAASFLSLPNSIEMGARSIGPAIGNMMGGDFAMPQESWLPDAGARFRDAATEVGAIKPETDDAAGQFARRVGQEIGATAIPMLGTPAKMATLLSSLGSGTGAASANLVAPDNAVAELIGQMIGGGIPLGAANGLERAAMKKAAPSVEELRAQAGGLYDAARNSGVTFPQATVKSAVDDITARALSEGLDETLHPGAVAAVKRLQAAAQTGMNAQDAQTIRRVIGGAAGNPANPDQSRIAGIMKRMFDTEITSAIPELAPANALFAQAKKGQMIEDAFTKARDTLGVNYNNAGMVTALRREFKRIIDNPKTAPGLSGAETDAIRAFVRGGPVENALRWAGRHAPTGTLSLGSAVGSGAGVGFLAGSPTVGAAVTGGLAGAGMLARGAGNRIATNAAQEIGAMLRGGAGPVPKVTPNTASAAAALGIGQAANQNDPTTLELIRLLRGNALN